MARPEGGASAPAHLRWMRVPWPPGFSARVYLIVGVVLAMVAALVARALTDGDLGDPLVNLVNHLFIGATSLVAAFTLGGAVALATALGAYAVAYVAVFPLLLAATRTELTIEIALAYQVDLAVVAFAWAAGAILLMAAKRALLAWVDRPRPSNDGRSR